MRTTNVSELRDQVLNFVTNHPQVNVTAISNKLKADQEKIRKIVKTLELEKKISSEKNGKAINYTTLSATPAKVTATPISDKDRGRNFGRNFGRIIINGEPLAKGKAVLAIVAAHVKKNPGITITKLKEVFPDGLIPGYGVFQDVKVSADRSERYFSNPNQLISLKGKKIAVCSQITTENIKNILAIATKIGQKFTLQKMA